MFLDVSPIKKPLLVTTLQALTKPNWRFIVNHYSKLVTGYFFENKDDMVKPTCELFHLWKQVGKAVKVLRCDNGGENIALKQRMNKCRLEIKN